MTDATAENLVKAETKSDEPTFSEKFWKVFRGHPAALAGLVGITIFVLLAIFAISIECRTIGM